MAGVKDQCELFLLEAKAAVKSFFKKIINLFKYEIFYNFSILKIINIFNPDIKGSI